MNIVPLVWVISICLTLSLGSVNAQLRDQNEIQYNEQPEMIPYCFQKAHEFHIVQMVHSYQMNNVSHAH